MSKKSKRQYRKETSPKVTTTVSPAPVSSPTSKNTFNPDYSYVMKDLRRIGTLAGSFILVLVILSFILR